MKHSHSLRIVTCLLSVLLMGSLLASCGEVPEETSVTTEGIAQTYKAIVCVDDQTFEIADAEGKTVAELLKEANVALKDGDVVSLDMDQVISDGLLIRVLRMGTVSFEILGENGQILEHYTVASTANTVADAMKILGISLAENQELSVPVDSGLKDGMTITVSVKQAEPTEETEPEETDQEGSSSSEPDLGNYGDNSGSASGGSPQPTVPATQPTVPATQPTVPATQPTQPTVPPTVPTAPPTEATTPPATEVTIVSIDYYDDPDGSGHGVKVITYSDGTQEEIPY